MAIKFTEKAAAAAAKPVPAKATTPVAAPPQEAAHIATKDAGKKPAKKAPRKAVKKDGAAESPLLDFNVTK